MTDPVLEAIAELVFADQLVDVHELEVLAEHPWFRSYQLRRDLDPEEFSTRLMTAHDDPAVDLQALRHLTSDEQESVLCLLADLAAIDDHTDPREEQVLARLAQGLQRLPPSVSTRLSEARQRTTVLRDKLNQPKPQPSTRVRLLRFADRTLGVAAVDAVTSRAGQGQRVKLWRRQTLFNHRAYAASLEQMRHLTAELMPQTQSTLESAAQSLQTLQERFTGITSDLLASELPKDSQEQLDSLLTTVRERLERIVQQDLDGLRNDLLAKQRSLKQFCMAAIGRTMAGKSTLIAALTGRDQGAIGNGQQGFTRYNRAYNFHGLRLIDTPGIGAAGGQGENFEQAALRDTEVARAIFPETDLVCFVIDSDSNVPCTRELMQQLHRRGKAFLVLLNVKVGLQGGIDRLRSRLEAKFAKQGEQSISGNITAIRRDLAQAIGEEEAARVPILPIHAKAAFKAMQAADPIEAEAWRELSRLDQVLEHLDGLITQQAPELRRRTLRANPRQELERIAHDLGTLEASLSNQARVFQEAQNSSAKQVLEIFADLQREVHNRIEAIFQALDVCVTSFSADNYRSNGKEVERRWKAELERFGLSSRVDDLAAWLKEELAIRLDALQNDIRDRLQFQVGAATLRSRLEFDLDIGFEEALRSNVKLGFKILSGFMAVLMFIPSPIQPFAWLGSLLAGFAPMLMDWFIPGADQRRREAQSALKNKLLESLRTPRAQISQQFDEALWSQRDQVAAAIAQGLGGSRTALLAFREQLLITQTDLMQRLPSLD
jgi:GTP-binding protein EngB required for normal cell division